MAKRKPPRCNLRLAFVFELSLRLGLGLNLPFMSP